MSPANPLALHKESLISLQISATSGDSVDHLNYKILNKDIPFTINAKTGDICTAKVLDRELKDSYEFAVSAEDGKFDAKVSVRLGVCRRKLR